MAIEMKDVTAVTLDGSDVTKIEDTAGNVLWKKSSGEENCLCFEPAESSNISVSYHNNGSNAPDMQYKVTGGADWQDWTADTAITVPVGQKMYVRGDNATGFSGSSSVYTNFVVTGNTKCSGNVMGLIDNGEGTATAVSYFCFYYLFKNCPITTSPELPAQTLANFCYYYMFYNCTNLTQPPELPAQTLAQCCYANMFYNCTNLTQPPELPAQTLEHSCYANMFYNCTNLTQAPELPAQTLVSYCYNYMFKSCTNLTQPPELPAQTLANFCYANMFYNCTNLKVSKSSGTPFLKFTTTATSSVWNMFTGTGGTFKGDPQPNVQYYYY